MPQPAWVTVVGCSGAGKTFFSHQAVDFLLQRGIKTPSNARIIHSDDWLLAVSPCHVKVLRSTFDVQRFSADVESLFYGKAIMKPLFDYTGSLRRSEYYGRLDLQQTVLIETRRFCPVPLLAEELSIQQRRKVLPEEVFVDVATRGIFERVTPRPGQIYIFEGTEILTYSRLASQVNLKLFLDAPFKERCQRNTRRHTNGERRINLSPKKQQQLYRYQKIFHGLQRIFHLLTTDYRVVD
ncbi:MAG: hypothetical protein WC901_06645 [Candidatus Margulisiibacteriota bacterium]